MGYALSHSRKQRIHIESSMFSSALTDWTVVITDSMVPELAEAGGLLDSAGPALSDGRDIRIAADIDGENGLPLDLRGFLQDADPANGRIEFATKIPLTDPVAGNDIYLFYGDDDATTLLPTDPLGQYEVYDDDTIFYAPVGGGANRTAFNITGTDVGGITAGDIAAPSGLLGTQHTDVGDYSTYGDNPNLDLVNTDWTVSFLFRATTSGVEQYILGKYNHTTQNRGYLCIFSGGQHFDLTYQPVRTSYNPIYRLSSGVDVVDGQWHHLAGTFISGTRASVYTEGILRNTTTNNIPSSVASNNASFQIGTQVTAQNQPADFSHVTVHSVARSADWIAATHNNFLNGDTLFTGYNYSPALGAVIPYSGNEAAYEAFNSVGGGFFKGGNDAYFNLGRSLAVPATVDVSIRLKYRKTGSAFFAILGNGIYNSEAVEVDFAGNLQFRAPTGGGSTQVVAMNAKTDSLWHEYQIDYNVAANTISTYKDGSPVTLDHVANFNGGVWDWSFLLRRTTTSQVFVDEIAFIEISIDGVVGHYFDFGLANAAGDAGPDRVWDLVGGIHGAAVNIVNANWKRTADLPGNLPDGYNLYYMDPDYPVPASLSNPGFDAYDVALVYGGVIDVPISVSYDTAIAIGKALSVSVDYSALVAISKAVGISAEYDAAIAISKALRVSRDYDTVIAIYKALGILIDYDTAISIAKVQSQVWQVLKIKTQTHPWAKLMVNTLPWAKLNLETKSGIAD
jgi:hypothetical protein